MFVIGLSGKVALVTGGSRGIGESIALGLAEAGADVAIVSRTIGDLEKVAAGISRLGRRSLAIPADMMKKDDIDKLVVKALGKFSHIDILVNNAALDIESSMLDVEEKLWHDTMAVNLTGYFFLSQAVAREMVKRKTGSIVNIASLIGVRPGPFVGHGVYSISKAGVIMMTMVLAKELGQYGIRVNAIAPGATETGMAKVVLSDANVRSGYIEKTALRRITQPQDIANAAIFFASEASNCITGQVLVIDAGEGI